MRGPNSICPDRRKAESIGGGATLNQTMGLRLSLAVLLVVIAGCGATNPGLGSQSPASSARMTPSTPASPSMPSTPARPSPRIASCGSATACPPALPVGGLAFDVDRETLVLFGGYTPITHVVLSQTWEWNAATGWKQLYPATVPPARGMTAMAYDEARHVVVMYGGRDTVNGTVPCGEVGREMCSADTWTWNGTDWTQLHPQTSPPPFLPAMTYDPPEAAVLLYNINVSIPETWSWDGANWMLKASGSNNPTPSRGSALMPFDPTTRHIVMFGGFTPGGGDVNVMWSWTGQSWTNLGIDAPLRSLQAAAAGDSDRHALLGYEDGPAETWAW